MGCDIHLYVEKKQDGKFVSADKWTKDEDSEDSERMSVDYDSRFWSGRSYNLFSILANVRNGVGFAGVPTGRGFVPIAMPRGLPGDACEEILKESERWREDGHSHSYLTVTELLAYDWTQTTNLCGWVSGPEFWKWNRYKRSQGESPEGYYGDVSGGSTKKVTEAEMIELLRPYTDHWKDGDKVKEVLKNTYCHCTWEMPYYRCARDFLSETIPKLLRLGAQDDVRIVFWFDN